MEQADLPGAFEDRSDGSGKVAERNLTGLSGSDIGRFQGMPPGEGSRIQAGQPTGGDRCSRSHGMRHVGRPEPLRQPEAESGHLATLPCVHRVPSHAASHQISSSGPRPSGSSSMAASSRRRVREKIWRTLAEETSYMVATVCDGDGSPFDFWTT